MMITRVDAKTRQVQRIPINGRDTRPGATLKWCRDHQEPVWVFPDRSMQCMYDLIIEATTSHTVIDGPWEVKD